MFSVFLIDPPWTHPGGWATTGRNRPSRHYPILSTAALAALPVGDLAAPNAALFLWTCWPMIFDAEQLIKAWGFRYSTIAWVWVKTQRNNPHAYASGLGYYTRANTEPCLLAIRGSMPPATNRELSLIIAPRRLHSQKPDEQYKKIARLYPHHSKIELFARHQQPGWTALGNHLTNNDIAQDIAATVKQFSKIAS